MSRQLYIHIGPHKTGTTYIQATLAAAASELANLGIGYIVGADRSGIAHHQIAECLVRNPPAVAAAKTLFHAALGDRQITIISSEVFSRVSRSAWTSLLSELPKDICCTFVCYLRSRSTVMYSLWQEQIKHGRTASVGEYVCNEVLYPHRSPPINFLSIIDRLPLSDGHKLKIVVYDNLIEDGIDLVDQLLSGVLGLDMPRAFGNREQVNRSFDPAFLEFLRSLNLISGIKNRPQSDKFRNGLLRLMQRDQDFKATVDRHCEELRQYLRSVELSSLDHNFVYLDKLLEKRHGAAVVNPRAREPFVLAHWKHSTTRMTTDPILNARLDYWQDLWRVHDAVESGLECRLRPHTFISTNSSIKGLEKSRAAPHQTL